MNNKFYRDFMSRKSPLIDLRYDNFFDEKELLFIWNQPKTPEQDSAGREPTIFKLDSSQIKEFLESKLRRPYLKYHNFIVDNVCLLRLDEPTKPHIDGHYPFVVRYNKKYCLTKTCVCPIAFDTELEDGRDIETTLTTFKQHCNYFFKNGLEFDRLILENKFYNDYDLEDVKNNKLKKHNNSFVNDFNRDEYIHVHHQYNGILTKGLDIENEFKLKQGSIASINPYQIHCTKTYSSNFIGKWVLRFLICELTK